MIPIAVGCGGAVFKPRSPRPARTRGSLPFALPQTFNVIYNRIILVHIIAGKIAPVQRRRAYNALPRCATRYINASIYILYLHLYIRTRVCCVRKPRARARAEKYRARARIRFLLHEGNRGEYESIRGERERADISLSRVDHARS